MAVDSIDKLIEAISKIEYQLAEINDTLQTVSEQMGEQTKATWAVSRR